MTMAKSYKQKFHALIAKGRQSGGRAMGGAKGSAIAAGSGAAAAYATGMAASKVEALRTNWWGAPLALAAAGHFVKKKGGMYHDVGASMLGAAGAIAYFQYAAQPQKQPAAAQTAGYGDAGMVVNSGEMDNAFSALATGYDDDHSQLTAGASDFTDAGADYSDAGMLISEAHGLES